MVPRRSQVDPLAASIGARVRSLRQENGLTLALAAKLGVELLDLLIIPDKNPRHRLIAQSCGLPDPVLRRWLTEVEELPVRPGPTRLMPANKTPKAAKTTTTKKAPTSVSCLPSTQRSP